MNRHNTLHMIRRIFFTVFILLIIFFLGVSWITSPVTDSFNTDDVYELNTVWYDSEGNPCASELPAQFPCDETGTLTVSATLPDQGTQFANCLCFRASQASVRIWIDGDLIREQEQAASSLPLSGKSPGSSWIIARLPENWYNKELRIELSSPYALYQGQLNPIYLGTKSALLYHIIHIRGNSFVLTLLLFFLSFLMLLFYMLYRTRKILNRQFLLLSIFGILAGIWMLGESQMLQFFTGRMVAWLHLTILALYLLPVPLLYIVADLPGFPYRRLCMAEAYLMEAYVFLLLILQVSGIRDFIEMLNVSMVILMIPCLSIPLLIFRDFLHNKNRKILPMTLAMTVLSVFSCIELIYDLIDLKMYFGNFFRTGIFAFYIIISIFSISQAMELFATGLKASYYRTLSYTDQMTGCRNRRSFMEREIAWTPGNHDVLIMADLNNLKTVNDTLGHQAGDAYIVACAEAMQEVFHTRGNCYRLGGDEFLFWGNYISEQELKRLERLFSDLVLEKCRHISPLCGIATGIAITSEEDGSIADTMKRADRNMYENKRIQKSVSDSDSEN